MYDPLKITPEIKKSFIDIDLDEHQKRKLPNIISFFRNV
jgi:hypothetical protein